MNDSNYTLPTITRDGKIQQSTYHPEVGTSLQGYITTSYDYLVELFGKPNSENDGYKTDVEWVINTPDGIATIYNYKDSKNYLGEEGTDIEKITDWHVGGENSSVYKWVVEAINPF